MSPSADKRNYSHADFAMRFIHIGNNTERQWEGRHNRLKRAVRQPYYGDYTMPLTMRPEFFYKSPRGTHTLDYPISPASPYHAFWFVVGNGPVSREGDPQ